MKRARRSAAKNRSTPGRTRGSAIYHQFDSIDVRGVVGSEEKHSFGNVFLLTPTAQRNCRRNELRKFCGLVCGDRGAWSALPNRSLRCAWCDHIHADVARCKVCGDGSRHGEDSTLSSCICGGAGLTEIVVDRPI